MPVPKFLQSALYSYNLKSLNAQRDYNLIITQVLNHGNWKQVQWLKKNYGLKKIKEVIKNPERGLWYFDVLNYWQIILGIKLSKKKIDKALFSLSPAGQT